MSFGKIVLLFVAALVVGVLVDTANPGCVSCSTSQTGLAIWLMGAGALQPVLSVTELSFRRRLTLWSKAMSVGLVNVGLGMILGNAVP